LFKSFLVYLPVFFTLSSPKNIIFGIPLTFILPTLIIIINFFYINKMKIINISSKITLIIILSTFLGIFYSGIFGTIKITSFFLFIASLILFIVYMSTILIYLDTNKNSFIKFSKYLFFILIFFMFIEIIYPYHFINMRGLLYSYENYEQLVRNEELRNAMFMGGITRPMLYFNEPSHLSKLLALTILIYGLNNKFNLNFILLFAFTFLIARSPTIFLLLPFLFLALFSLFQKTNPLRLLIVFLFLFISLMIMGIIVYIRIEGIIENGSGSLNERFIYPLIYLYENSLSQLLFGFGAGGHGELYRYVYDLMAETRPHWGYTNNPITASSATLIFFGVFGVFGSLLFLILEKILIKEKIYFIILSTSIFLTGYNTPSTFLILAFVLAIYIYYKNTTKGKKCLII